MVRKGANTNIFQTISFSFSNPFLSSLFLLPVSTFFPFFPSLCFILSFIFKTPLLYSLFIIILSFPFYRRSFSSLLISFSFSNYSFVRSPLLSSTSSNQLLLLFFFFPFSFPSSLLHYCSSHSSFISTFPIYFIYSLLVLLLCFLSCNLLLFLLFFHFSFPSCLIFPIFSFHTFTFSSPSSSHLCLH